MSRQGNRLDGIGDAPLGLDTLYKLRVLPKHIAQEATNATEEMVIDMLRNAYGAAIKDLAKPAVCSLVHSSGLNFPTVRTALLLRGQPPTEEEIVACVCVAGVRDRLLVLYNAINKNAGQRFRDVQKILLLGVANLARERLNHPYILAVVHPGEKEAFEGVGFADVKKQLRSLQSKYPELCGVEELARKFCSVKAQIWIFQTEGAKAALDIVIEAERASGSALAAGARPGPMASTERGTGGATAGPAPGSNNPSAGRPPVPMAAGNAERTRLWRRSSQSTSAAGDLVTGKPLPRGPAPDASASTRCLGMPLSNNVAVARTGRAAEEARPTAAVGGRAVAAIGRNARAVKASHTAFPLQDGQNGTIGAATDDGGGGGPSEPISQAAVPLQAASPLPLPRPGETTDSSMALSPSPQHHDQEGDVEGARGVDCGKGYPGEKRGLGDIQKTQQTVPAFETQAVAQSLELGLAAGGCVAQCGMSQGAAGRRERDVEEVAAPSAERQPEPHRSQQLQQDLQPQQRQENQRLEEQQPQLLERHVPVQGLQPQQQQMLPGGTGFRGFRGAVTSTPRVLVASGANVAAAAVGTAPEIQEPARKKIHFALMNMPAVAMPGSAGGRNNGGYGTNAMPGTAAAAVCAAAAAAPAAAGTATEPAARPLNWDVAATRLDDLQGCRTLGTAAGGVAGCPGAQRLTPAAQGLPDEEEQQPGVRRVSYPVAAPARPQGPLPWRRQRRQQQQQPWLYDDTGPGSIALRLAAAKGFIGRALALRHTAAAEDRAGPSTSRDQCQGAGAATGNGAESSGVAHRVAEGILDLVCWVDNADEEEVMQVLRMLRSCTRGAPEGRLQQQTPGSYDHAAALRGLGAAVAAPTAAAAAPALAAAPATTSGNPHGTRKRPRDAAAGEAAKGTSVGGAACPLRAATGLLGGSGSSSDGGGNGRPQRHGSPCRSELPGFARGPPEGDSGPAPLVPNPAAVETVETRGGRPPRAAALLAERVWRQLDPPDAGLPQKRRRRQDELASPHAAAGGDAIVDLPQRRCPAVGSQAAGYAEEGAGGTGAGTAVRGEVQLFAQTPSCCTAEPQRPPEIRKPSAAGSPAAWQQVSKFPGLAGSSLGGLASPRRAQRPHGLSLPLRPFVSPSGCRSDNCLHVEQQQPRLQQQQQQNHHHQQQQQQQQQQPQGQEAPPQRPVSQICPRSQGRRGPATSESHPGRSHHRGRAPPVLRTRQLSAAAQVEAKNLQLQPLHARLRAPAAASRAEWESMAYRVFHYLQEQPAGLWHSRPSILGMLDTFQRDRRKELGKGVGPPPQAPSSAAAVMTLQPAGSLACAKTCDAQCIDAGPGRGGHGICSAATALRVATNVPGGDGQEATGDGDDSLAPAAATAPAAAGGSDGSAAACGGPGDQDRGKGGIGSQGGSSWVASSHQCKMLLQQLANSVFPCGAVVERVRDERFTVHYFRLRPLVDEAIDDGDDLDAVKTEVASGPAEQGGRPQATSGPGVATGTAAACGASGSAPIPPSSFGLHSWPMLVAAAGVSMPQQPGCQVEVGQGGSETDVNLRPPSLLTGRCVSTLDSASRSRSPTLTSRPSCAATASAAPPMAPAGAVRPPTHSSLLAAATVAATPPPPETRLGATPMAMDMTNGLWYLAEVVAAELDGDEVELVFKGFDEPPSRRSATDGTVFWGRDSEIIWHNVYRHDGSWLPLPWKEPFKKLGVKEVQEAILWAAAAAASKSRKGPRRRHWRNGQTVSGSGDGGATPALVLASSTLPAPLPLPAESAGHCREQELAMTMEATEGASETYQGLVCAVTESARGEEEAPPRAVLAWPTPQPERPANDNMEELVTAAATEGLILRPQMPAPGLVFCRQAADDEQAPGATTAAESAVMSPSLTPSVSLRQAAGMPPLTATGSDGRGGVSGWIGQALLAAMMHHRLRTIGTLSAAVMLSARRWGVATAWGSTGSGGFGSSDVTHGPWGRALKRHRCKQTEDKADRLMAHFEEGTAAEAELEAVPEPVAMDGTRARNEVLNAGR